MSAPRWQSRATTSKWPLVAAMATEVNPSYPTQIEEQQYDIKWAKIILHKLDT